MKKLERGKLYKMKSVESKRKLLEESIASMSQEADALTVQAEKKHSFFLAQSNAFRQKIHESKANAKSLRTSTQFETEAKVYGINKIWSSLINWIGWQQFNKIWFKLKNNIYLLLDYKLY